MAEEATNLSPGQDSTRVWVLVVRHHLDPQRLQLGRIESPERENVGVMVGKFNCHYAAESVVSENTRKSKSASCYKKHILSHKQWLEEGLGHSQKIRVLITVSAKEGKQVEHIATATLNHCLNKMLGYRRQIKLDEMGDRRLRVILADIQAVELKAHQRFQGEKLEVCCCAEQTMDFFVRIKSAFRSVH